MKHLQQIALAGCLATGPAFADEVDPSQVTTFAPNTTAKASEMNTTINALISAINDNASRISALEGTVTPSSNLTGAVFCLYEINNSLQATSDCCSWGMGTGPMISRLEFGASTVTLTELYLNLGEAPNPGGGIEIDQEIYPSEVMPYSVDANNKVTLTEDGEQLSIQLTPDGRMLIGVFSESESINEPGFTGELFDANLSIGVRVPNASACSAP